MKARNISLMLCAFIGMQLCNFAHSQENPNKTSKKEIIYSYDDAGNRVGRNVIFLKTDSIQEKGDEDGVNSLALDTQANASGETIYEEEIGDCKITIFPNPTKGKLKIEISNYEPELGAQITLYSPSGSILLKHDGVSSMNVIDLSAQPKGTYLLSLYLNKKYSTWKIIKE